MYHKVRFSVVAAAMLLFVALTTACGGSFIANEVSPVSSTTVTSDLQYVDGAHLGPVYNFSVSVPEDWVNTFEVQNLGNKLYFNYVKESGIASQVFYIEALSEEQYWQQTGAHPGSYTPIVNQGDTYFIYYLPIDGYYGSLTDAQLETFSTAVPEIIASFVVN